VKDARFAEGDVVRVYSGVAGPNGIAVALGLTGNPGIIWQNGWRQLSVVAELPGVKVFSISQ
jgi:hypothetical protein